MEQEFEAATGPAGVFLIDANLLNNGWRSYDNPEPALYRGLRMLLQTQSQFTFSSLIG